MKRHTSIRVGHWNAVVARQTVHEAGISWHSQPLIGTDSCVGIGGATHARTLNSVDWTTKTGVQKPRMTAQVRIIELGRKHEDDDDDENDDGDALAVAAVAVGDGGDTLVEDRWWRAE